MNERVVTIHRARALLFVPGARPDRFARALSSGADLIVLDLEASVRSVEKDQARRAVRTWITGCGSPQRALVRVNPLASAWFADDMEALEDVPCAGIVIAMANDAAAVRAVIGAMPDDRPAIALIETAAGILASAEIARVPGVARLAFGNMDYATDTRTRGRDSMIHPSACLVLASRAAGLPPPIAGVTAAFRDASLLADDAAWERDQGFGAKFCIHPDQVDIVARAFAPTPEELAWARRVVAAAGDSYACEVDGELVDRPVVERARSMLDGAP